MTDPHGPSTPDDPGVESIPTTSSEPTSPGAAPTDDARARILRRLVRVAAVAVVIVVGVIGYLVFFQKSDPTAAKVGDCVSIKGSASNATAMRLSCDDPKALYVVTAAGRSVTCDSHEVSYAGNSRDHTKFCLFYNVRVGDCLTLTQGGSGDTKGACVAGSSRVVSVRTDTSTSSQCPAEADAALSNPTRNRLICFASVS